MSGYQNLLTYQQSEEIYDLTVEFCQRFLPGRELLRQRDQMVQAARSGKQNIVEGYTLKSLKGYIRLLGVSRGSLEELLEDFLDFARVHGVKLWPRDDPRLRGSKGRMGRMRGKSGEGRWRLPLTPSNPSDPSYPVNYMVDLINRTCFLLHRQIESLEKKFIEEGGYSENLFNKRLEFRKTLQLPKKW